MPKYKNPPNQSKGILDDFAVRKNIATKEGTITRVPVADIDIANKLYVDGEIVDKAWLQATNQTGLTGDKTGSFNLTTSNSGTFGGVTLLDSDLTFVDFTEDSVLFIGPDGAVKEDKLNFTWDSTNKNLTIANPSAGVPITLGRLTGSASVKAKSDAEFGWLIFDGYDDTSVMGLNYYTAGDVHLARGGGDVYMCSANTAADAALLFTNTARISANVGTNDHIHIMGKGTGGVFLNYYKGSGGVFFGDGSTTVVGTVDSSGNMQLDGDIEGGTATGKFKLTSTGGFAIKITNKTGGVTVQGQLAIVYSATAVDDAFTIAALNDDGVFGIVLDAGVADGSEAWIVVGGIADVLMDAGGSARGDRIISSPNTAGSGDVWNVGGAVATHFQEIGHCIETRVGAGLARIVLHFN